MNISQALAAEHSKRVTEEIVEFIGEDPERFAELMQVFFAGEYRLTQRAAWPMSHAVERHPKLIKPYLPKLIRCLEDKTGHPAARRNVVRLLQYIEIPKRWAGKIFSSCIDLIDDPREQIAVRAFALTTATKIAKKEEALFKELQLVVKKNLPHATAAIRVRAREVID